MNPLELSNLFIENKGIYGQIYKSASFSDKEITIDDFTGEYRVCLCTPYNLRMDKHKFRMGAGEVVKEWFFSTFNESLNFLLSNGVV